MARRAIFVDFDGTYAHHSEVPALHREAVAAAQAAGNAVFLATGRPLAMVPDGVLDGLDGLVGSAGSYVQVADRVVVDDRFDAALGNRTVDVLRAHSAAFILESPDRLYGPPGLEGALLALRDRLGLPRSGGVFDRIELTEQLHDIPFSKVTVAACETPMPQLVAEIGDGVDWVGASIPGVEVGGGEIYRAGVTKATGLAVVCEVLGVAQADAVAFGDGANDVEMIEWAGTGVAMERSNPRALAVADTVVPGPENAGLAQAFADLGLR